MRNLKTLLKPGTKPGPSEFIGVRDIEYFQFEEDFVEANMRCIPMIVRFKMDLAGIKLKLAEWVKFKTDERIRLASMACTSAEEILEYRNYLKSLILHHTGAEATPLVVNSHPAWANKSAVPNDLKEHAEKYDSLLSTSQWAALTNLQRFALLKLIKEGHENKNFPIAMREFGLAKKHKSISEA